MIFLKQSTSVTLKVGPFVDDTDGKTPQTGLSISQADVRISKNGGNYIQKNEASSATHDEYGWYDIDLDSTDTDKLGSLKLAVNESGALPVWQDYMIVPSHIYDWMFGNDALYENAAKVLTNKAVQAKTTGEIKYYDDDGQTVILTQTPSETDSEITRTPS